MHYFVQLVILIGLTIVSAGCSSNKQTEYPTAATPVQVNSTILKSSNFEFESPTGEWFCCEGGKQGKFSLESSVGTKIPGSEVIVRLKPNGEEVTVKRNIRFRLTERNKDRTYARTVDEITLYYESTNSYPTGYTTKLPGKEGAFYFLTVEALDGKEVEDTILTSIEVPIQQVVASMSTKEQNYKGNERVKLVVKNEGPTNLLFGTSYSLQKMEDGKWIPIQPERSVRFKSIGIIVKPEGTWEQEAQLESLALGHYRFIKEVEGEGTNIKLQIYAEFDVKN